jgi:hypothetical protein
VSDHGHVLHKAVALKNTAAQVGYHERRTFKTGASGYNDLQVFPSTISC